MHRTGRPGRGERGRVAARMSALLGAEESPRVGWLPSALHDGRDDVGAAAHRAIPDHDAIPGAGGPSRRLRWQPDRRGLLALVAVVLAVGVAMLWWVLSSRPSEVAVRAVSGTAAAVPAPPASALPGSTLGATHPAGAGPSAVPLDLVIDVAGQVEHPGVYRLPPGARVIDALQAAGGALPGVSTDTLNLAAPLRDGQQVAVGVAGAPNAATAGAGGAAFGTGAALVNLNTAGAGELQALPGVGPVLAQHILDWRAEHGRFATVDQLNEVSGIGQAKFAALRSHVTV